MVVGLAVDMHHIINAEVVFLGKGKVALIVRRHTHHGAIAITHQHVVADPHVTGVTGQRVGHLAGRWACPAFL
jgi:hypothetical protein